MAHIQIGDYTPRISYQVGSTPSTVFEVPFPFFQNGDLDVYVDGVLQILDFDYSVTGAGESAGGEVTFVNPIDNALVAIVRNMPIKRDTDYPTSGPFQINALNTDLDKIVAWQQEAMTRILRSLRPPDSDPDGDFTLPPATTRAGNFLGFDSNGAPVIMVPAENYPASVYGASLIQAGNAAAARVILGMSTAGSALVIAADSAAQKLLLDIVTSTQPEAAAGLLNTGKMTPLRTRDAIDGYAVPMIGMPPPRGLVVTVTSDTAVGATADEVVVSDGSKLRRLTNVNVSAAITTSGANGLDTGSEASSTWYALHLIYNPTTDTKALLLSLSATAPTLPSGYTFFRRLGWVRNNSLSDLFRTIQIGNHAAYVFGTNPSSDLAIVTGNSGGTNVSYANFIPPTASTIIGTISGTVGPSTSDVIRVGPSTGIDAARIGTQTTGSAVSGAAQFMLTTANQTMRWAAQATSPRADVRGWFEPF